jgi:hypothetical protein
MLSHDRNIQIGRAVTDLIRSEVVSSHIVKVTQEANVILLTEPLKLAASIAIPLELFGSHLPSELKSCRLSVLRGGTEYHIEKHPNAIQYVLSVEGKGTIRVKTDDSWKVSNLSSGPSVGLLERWHIVPADTWHQPIPGENDWTVIAFHTTSAAELKDEYGYSE